MARTPPPGGPISMEERNEMEIQAFYADLHKAASNNQDDRVLKLAGKILHLDPTDEVAYQCKVVSFIKLGKYKEGHFFVRDNPKLAWTVPYEQAYCLYRMQKITEAKAILDAWNDRSHRKAELMYQITYRMDKYEQAYDMLLDVIKISSDEMDEERQVNLSAMHALMIMNGSTKQLKRIEGSGYELLYNYGVLLLAQKRYPEAEEILYKAEVMCKETAFDTEATNEEEINDEIALLKTQRAFCIHIQGRVKLATRLYMEVLQLKPSDPAVLAVLSNNLLCANKEGSIFDAKKKIKAMTADDSLNKMNYIQRRDMSLNEALFNLHIRHEDTYEICDIVEKKFPELAEMCLIARCTLKCWTDGVEAARKEILPKLAKGSETWLRINLVTVQLALEKKLIEPAISYLKQLDSDFYRPGIISALVSLYHSRGMKPEAAKILQDAVEHYRKNKSNVDFMRLLWRQTASFLMAQGNYRGAAETLEDLRKTAKDDSLVLSQLVIAYSQFDIDKAKALSKLLPPLPDSKVDAATLASPNWMAHIKFLKRGYIKNVNRIGSGERKPKAKKKKKAKMPKNYIADRKPDPERWLPKFERTGYRPKKTRRGRGDVGKGTQGADTASASKYDMSSKVGSRDSASETPTNTAVWRKDHQKKKKRRK